MKDQVAAVAARDAAEAEVRISRLSAVRERKEIAESELWTCLGQKTRALVASGERAELVADATLAVCGLELERYLDAAVAWQRLQDAGSSNLPGLRSELAAIVRKQAVNLAVVVKSETPPAGTAAPKVATAAATKEAAAVYSCIEQVAGNARSKFAEQEAKLASILDLCRPEIEAAARASFAVSRDTLDEERQKAFVQAKSMAERALAR